LELRRITWVVDVLGEVEWLARLPLVCAVELPAADDGIEKAVDILADPPAAAQRQPIARRHSVSVRAVVRRDANLKLWIGRVQVTELLAQARASVRGVKRQVAREALAGLDLKRLVLVRAVVLLHPHVGELRERQKQLRPRERLRRVE